VRSRLAPTVRTLPKGILGVTHFPPARIVGTNHKVKRVGQGFGASASDSFRPTLALRRRLTGSPNRNVVRSLPTLSGEDPLWRAAGGEHRRGRRLYRLAAAAGQPPPVAAEETANGRFNGNLSAPSDHTIQTNPHYAEALAGAQPAELASGWSGQQVCRLPSDNLLPAGVHMWKAVVAGELYPRQRV
jgi:hypothetical protein